MARQSAKPQAAAAAQRKRDLEALALIKSSGILKPNAKLDAVLKLSGRLGAEARARGHIFIFSNVVFRECPF
jgi:hypothetical protein